MCQDNPVKPISCIPACVAALAAAAPGQPPADAPYRSAKVAVEERVEDLLKRMTPEERAEMLAGGGWMESHANPRLGIPAIKMADGPLGVRNWAGPSAVTNSAGVKPVHSTAFGSGIAMAAAWDPELAERTARAVAQEVKALGRDMILGPTVNINRVPLWGRNFEGYGEDPYLASRLAVAYIRGVQGEGVIPSVKHFAANNQEFERHRVDEAISERALEEIYYPAFRAAVQEAGVWAVMSAYEKLNGEWCAENASLLNDTLKKRWGFRGFVISDWGSTYSTAATVNAGLDLEMPGGEPMRHWLAQPSTQHDGNGCGWLETDKVMAAIAKGTVKQETVDDAVRRLLRVMFTAGLFDHPHTPGGDVDTPEQRAVARAGATEGIVLLKNAGSALPLDAGHIRSLAVIGPSAAIARTGGGGSSHVSPNYAVAPLEGIKEIAGSRVEVRYALGAPMEGESASASAQAMRDEAVALARRSDAAVVVVGYSAALESEGFDRQSMDLPAGQDELIEAIAAANPHTTVVVVAGSPVTMTRWIDRVPAVLFAWYGGQEGGHAIADVLFGAVNPSGKLPVTFPKQWKDSPAYGHYPGENLHVAYAEGIYVGYRGFDQHNIEPLFPFGHGLSYTRFEYSGLTVTPRVAPSQPVTVTLTLRNAGSRAGAEVVEVYLHQLHPSEDRPPKELKAFRRVTLAAGESQTVQLELAPEAMSFYSTARKDWVTEPGTFEILAGASSRDIRLKATFELGR